MYQTASHCSNVQCEKVNLKWISDDDDNDNNRNENQNSNRKSLILRVPALICVAVHMELTLLNEIENGVWDDEEHVELKCEN
ncbi:hypothetical protein L1987_79057 [Smallanthus sonchifolius]|uniref:Uncharacterized protein n=1 Tax=Smallanthus sonchifolius TaxID=185202 RepID=A0ACB8ZFF9_9ASTR|nr:hypothetical protein L1987_79057 [Smallanthus sonchifolius]